MHQKHKIVKLSLCWQHEKELAVGKKIGGYSIFETLRISFLARGTMNVEALYKTG